MPEGSMEVLSQNEVNQLRDTSQGGLHELYRRCSLAVLNSGSAVDDSAMVMEQFKSFGIRIIQQERGFGLELTNAPDNAFVDREMIRGIKEHLFTVLRDIVYTRNSVERGDRFDLTRSADITDAVFHILRNADVLTTQKRADLVVCWGGHSIGREEYDYTKQVGYELGLRGLNICTGCGPGAMKGPMKGATIGHAKQRIGRGRYLGISEPGIIAAESPNPIVNELVILPDMEKRLEAFVRTGHGIVVFPGGVGTAEEILYLLGILLHPENRELPFPLIFTGPADSAEYFQLIASFLAATLGEEAGARYRIIVDDPAAVARAMCEGLNKVQSFRDSRNDAYHFNWSLLIDADFQQPFEPSHEGMAGLRLHRDQPTNELAAELRRAFSGIVAGNVKEGGIRAIREYGPFELRGDPAVIKPLDRLLESFVTRHRMKLAGTAYQPCYRIVS